MNIAVDTSAIMAVLLDEPTRPRLLELTRDCVLQSAPTLPWEVGNALTALLRRSKIGLEQARSALESFDRIPVRLVEVELPEAVDLAHEHGIYAYDAYMLECSLRYRVPFLSLDGVQRTVARRIGIEVIEV